MDKMIFSNTGGYPLDLDNLGFGLSGIIDALNGFVKATVPAATPVIVSGLSYAVVGSDTVYQPGWLYLPGLFTDLIYCAGGTVANVLGPGQVHSVVCNVTELPATYNDGVDRAITSTVTCTVSYAPDQAYDGAATTFRFADLKPYLPQMGVLTRETAWTTIMVTTGAGSGTLSGSVKYRKNSFTNQLEIMVNVSVGSPGDFADIASGGSMTTVATLPSGYHPNNSATVPLTALTGTAPVHSNNIYSYYGSVGYLNTTGAFQILFMSLNGGVSSYNVSGRFFVGMD